MLNSSPVIIIEKDRAMQLMYQTILKDLKVRHQLLFFENANEALFYLKNMSEFPLLIICNAFMPRVSGLELKEKINNSKCLAASASFILFTQKATGQQVSKSYELGIQGLFNYNTSYDDLKHNFGMILNKVTEEKSQHLLAKEPAENLAVVA